MSKNIELYNRKLNFVLPETYSEATAEDMKKLPILSSKMDHVFISDHGKSFVTVNCNGEELKPEEIENRIQYYYNIYRRISPGFEATDIMRKDKNGFSACAFYFKSTTLTDDWYNLIVITQIDNKETLLTMHCCMDMLFKENTTFMNLVTSFEIV